MVFRSILFWFLVFTLSILTTILFFPVLFFKSSKGADFVGKNWGIIILFLLRVIGGINHKILNKENLPQEPLIIASKHQSMWETIIMKILFPRPVPIFKKELALIPIFGWFLLKSSSIKVDRTGGSKTLKSLIKQAQKYLKNKQNIIIFPQGTRVPALVDNKKYKYQSGVAALYLNCNVSVIPVALDSGLFWNKKNLLLKPGTITLKFLDPIKPGLNKKEFMHQLQNSIETAADEMIKKRL